MTPSAWTNAQTPDIVGTDSVLDEWVHVYPTFGRQHVLSPDCWCYPDTDEDHPGVLLHHEDN